LGLALSLDDVPVAGPPSLHCRIGEHLDSGTPLNSVLGAMVYLDEIMVASKVPHTKLLCASHFWEEREVTL